MVGELILVVDDGQENREFIVDYILSPNGYRALTAKDGREALDLMESTPPDLILLDYQMPRMTGIDVLRAMQANNWNIPVILMTFYGSEEVAVEVYRLGVRDYVKKPFSVDEMIEAIERSLSEVRLRSDRDALTDRLLASNRELQLRTQEFRTIYSMGQSITSAAEAGELLPALIQSALHLTGANEGYLYMAHRGRLICKAQKRPAQGRPERCDYEANDGAARRVLDKGETYLKIPGPNAAEASLVYIPLVLRGEPIGVLGVRSEPSAPLSRHHAALLNSLASYAVIALGHLQVLDESPERTPDGGGQAQALFQHFVPPQVAQMLLHNPEALRDGVRRRDVTVLFADLRGYAAYAEQMAPQQVAIMLNDYLTLATEIIIRYGGTPGKVAGDGLMALFNAPDDQPDHVQAALEAALTLQQGAAGLAHKRGDGLSFGIGIHSGQAVVGFIGTEDGAINYTAVGDIVHVARRLQEAARPGQILLEDALAQMVKGRAQVHPLGELKIKGRSANAIAYALQGLE